MANLEQQFQVMSTEELMNVEGGIGLGATAAIITIGVGLYQIGEAAGKTLYYVTHPR